MDYILVGDDQPLIEEGERTRLVVNPNMLINLHEFPATQADEVYNLHLSPYPLANALPLHGHLTNTRQHQLSILKSVSQSVLSPLTAYLMQASALGGPLLEDKSPAVFKLPIFDQTLQLALLIDNWRLISHFPCNTTYRNARKSSV